MAGLPPPGAPACAASSDLSPVLHRQELLGAIEESVGEILSAIGDCDLLALQQVLQCLVEATTILGNQRRETLLALRRAAGSESPGSQLSDCASEGEGPASKRPRYVELESQGGSQESGSYGSSAGSHECEEGGGEA